MSLTHTLCTWRARLSRLPYSLIALLGRFSIAAVFWRSGQTKVDNFSLDIISGEFSLGWPSLNASAVFLFREEYRLPLISPELGALLAATAEHVFPLLLMLGLASRISALALLGMTLVIQVLVYPGAWPLHGVWATVLLLLAARGPGMVSLDHWLTGKVCD